MGASWGTENHLLEFGGVERTGGPGEEQEGREKVGSCQGLGYAPSGWQARERRAWVARMRFVWVRVRSARDLGSPGEESCGWRERREFQGPGTGFWGAGL